jgi:hypothetical protein
MTTIAVSKQDENFFSVKVNFWGYEGLSKSFNKNF